MDKLKGKTVLITGGTSGIGLASAKLFLNEGARVAITGRDPEGLAAAQQALGPDALVIRSDVRDLDAIDAAILQVQERFDRLDVLFVNAGVAKASPLATVTESHYDELAEINLKGAFFTIQKALPILSRPASIIVTTSISGRIATPHFSLYGATKAALSSLVKSLSLVLAESGIRINAICPGPVATPIFDRFGLPEDMLKAKKQEIEVKSPMKRFGSPDEIARIALVLASDDSSYMTGEEIVVDGGMSLT
ncbi:SDR family oxidoreductase [Noviherbaspirillum sp. ST9]|uniref:SDR family oxidoreductase n=1 Tax=Noviherbaspirillum sp. ST9 TaxID=3401606 RepID=UPI003B586133